MTPESTPGSRAIAESAGVPGNHIDHLGNRHVDRLMLPEPDYLPADLTKSGIRGAVPVHVAAQLGFPVPSIRRWLAAVLRTAMPEAAIHEDGDLPGGEHDVWPDPDPVSKVEPVILAIAEAQPVQRPPQRQLGLRVGAAVGPHVRRTPGAGWLRIPRPRGRPSSRAHDARGSRADHAPGSRAHRAPGGRGRWAGHDPGARASRRRIFRHTGSG